MIWILTDDGWGPVASRVRDSLDELGAPVLMLTPDLCKDLSVEVEGTALSAMVGATPIELPSAVLYLRDPLPAIDPSAQLEADVSNFVTQQWHIMVRGLVRAIEAKGVPILNPTSAILVDEKTAQLISAAECGFTTPPALHTARGHNAALFARQHRDRCASKPFAPFVRLAGNGTSMQRILTNRTSGDELRAGMNGAKVASPTIVQPFVEAPYEHRVVVVDHHVFGARVERQGANAVDVRRLSPTEATITPSQLPPEVAQRCRDLVRKHHLYFAALDLLETDMGEFVFLDLNPAGHFLWVEQLTGAPICRSLAESAHRASQRACSLA